MTWTTKTGIRIGCLAPKSPPPHHDRDALRLQDALINPGKRFGQPVDVDGIVIAVCTVSLGFAALLITFTA